MGSKIVYALLALTIAAGLIVPTLFTVQRTADYTLGTRQVLCIGILHNTANTAATDPTVIRLCAAVGVKPLP